MAPDLERIPTKDETRLSCERYLADGGICASDEASSGCEDQSAPDRDRDEQERQGEAQTEGRRCRGHRQSEIRTAPFTPPEPDGSDGIHRGDGHQADTQRNERFLTEALERSAEGAEPERGHGQFAGAPETCQGDGHQHGERHVGKEQCRGDSGRVRRSGTTGGSHAMSMRAPAYMGGSVVPSGDA